MTKPGLACFFRHHIKSHMNLTVTNVIVWLLKFPFPPRVRAGVRTPEKKTIIPYRRSNNISG